MPLDRETLASTVLATGGAWLLGLALVHSRSGKWNGVQLKGMVYVGGGFLLSAAAARWLQHTGPRGGAVSLMGTMFAMRGMYLLIRERAAQQAATRPPQPPTSE
ncbi:hypothetical protein [Gemmatimonas sp.]|jgi:hypothetical protein|uniref:hypothetical protein n=1 Tax=Gemmatimonas sp. TaxID=1962908 RepID=UPI003DA5BBFD